jgi:ectoine hydroxylase-related dioxygenase (phytanoyl-CoA dioxygenase family)
MYWRLVRPGVHGDIGPLHADKWFWDIGVYPGVVPEGATRAKVWVAVYCEPGASGLQVVPGSQNDNIPWERKVVHGMIKPQLLVEESTLDAITLPTTPGDAVVFHDELIHGGSRTPCSLTRVSFEFTIMYQS